METLETQIDSYPEHGGDLKLAEKLAGCSSHEINDFSVNVNPMGPPRLIAEHWNEMQNLLERYPDPGYEELKDAIAERYKLEVENIFISNGSTELIYLLPKIIGPEKQVGLVTPCFSEYLRSFRLGQMETRFIPLHEKEDFTLSGKRVLEFLTTSKNIGALVLSNPNNPTGRLIEREVLLEILEHCERNQIFLIVDESYIEFCKSGNSLKQKSNAYKYLILIRSMTKFYCLPGIRLGFGLLHPEWVRTLEKHRPPWSVNNLAQKLGALAIRDFEYAARSREYVKKQMKSISRQLGGMDDIEVVPSDCNFLLFKLKRNNPEFSDRLYCYLLRNRILIRHCGNFQGLDHTFFRIAAMKRTCNLALMDSLKNFFDMADSHYVNG